MQPAATIDNYITNAQNKISILEVPFFHIYLKVFDASGHVAFHAGQILNGGQGMLSTQVDYDRMRISCAGFGAPVSRLLQVENLICRSPPTARERGVLRFRQGDTFQQYMPSLFRLAHSRLRCIHNVPKPACRTSFPAIRCLP